MEAIPIRHPPVSSANISHYPQSCLPPSPHSNTLILYGNLNSGQQPTTSLLNYIPVNNYQQPRFQMMQAHDDDQANDSTPYSFHPQNVSPTMFRCSLSPSQPQQESLYELVEYYKQQVSESNQQIIHKNIKIIELDKKCSHLTIKLSNLTNDNLNKVRQLYDVNNNLEKTVKSAMCTFEQFTDTKLELERRQEKIQQLLAEKEKLQTTIQVIKKDAKSSQNSYIQQTIYAVRKEQKAREQMKKVQIEMQKEVDENVRLTLALKGKSLESELRGKQIDADKVTSQSQCKKLAKHNDELKAEIISLKLELENERDSKKQVKGNLKQARKENNVLKGELVAKKRSTKVAEKTFEKYINEIRIVTSQRNRQTAKNGILEAKLEKVEKLLQIEQDKSKNLEEKYTALETESTAEMLNNEKEKAELYQELERMQQSMEELIEEKEKLHEYIIEMRKLNGCLEREIKEEKKKNADKHKTEKKFEKVKKDYLDLVEKYQRVENKTMKSLNIDTAQEKTPTKFTGKVGGGRTSTRGGSWSSCLPSTSIQAKGSSYPAGVKRTLTAAESLRKRQRQAERGGQETNKDTFECIDVEDNDECVDVDVVGVDEDILTVSDSE